MTLATRHVGEDTSKPAATSLLASVGLFGVGVFVLATSALHFSQPRLDPMREAVSYYVHGRSGWALTVGLVALAVGSAALTIDVARGLRGGRAGVACLALWSVGVFLGGVFPADPPGNWSRPPSAAGAVHGIAAMVALAVLPVAALLLSRAFRRDPRWQRSSGGPGVPGRPNRGVLRGVHGEPGTGLRPARPSRPARPDRARPAGRRRRLAVRRGDAAHSPHDGFRNGEGSTQAAGRVVAFVTHQYPEYRV